MFQRCRKLKHITLPDDLEMIGEYCFQESGLTELTIPSSVKTIEQYSFADCAALTACELPAGAAVAESAFKGTPLEGVL